MDLINQPGRVPMELNARVDKVGKDHHGGHIYKVVVDGQELYLSDARLEPGQSITLDAGVVDIAAVGNTSSKLSDDEPDIRGIISGGISSAWIDWYRVQGKGCSLIEARDAGLLRLAELKSK